MVEVSPVSEEPGMIYRITTTDKGGYSLAKGRGRQTACGGMFPFEVWTVHRMGTPPSAWGACPP
jgi:hypothetical protein